MSAVEDILSQIPLNQLAGQLGINEQEAEQAARTALPALLGGIQANTDDPGGAASFAQAVQQHDWDQHHPGLQVTVSVGVATSQRADAVLAAADKALYSAKSQGRDQVVLL